MTVEGGELPSHKDMGKDNNDSDGRESIERYAYSRRVACQSAMRAAMKHGWAGAAILRVARTAFVCMGFLPWSLLGVWWWRASVQVRERPGEGPP
jgi:hypothetical protein